VERRGRITYTLGDGEKDMKSLGRVVLLLRLGVDKRMSEAKPESICRRGLGLAGAMVCGFCMLKLGEGGRRAESLRVRAAWVR
jgi:hypothetical protein